jgi:hypothetical protein
MTGSLDGVAKCPTFPCQVNVAVLLKHGPSSQDVISDDDQTIAFEISKWASRTDSEPLSCYLDGVKQINVESAISNGVAQGRCGTGTQGKGGL